MIKVDCIPVDHLPKDTLLLLPQAQEIWAVTRKENAETGKSTLKLCRENFNKDPVFIFEDISLRVDYFGVNYE